MTYSDYHSRLKFSWYPVLKIFHGNTSFETIVCLLNLLFEKVLIEGNFLNMTFFCRLHNEMGHSEPRYIHAKHYLVIVLMRSAKA